MRTFNQRRLASDIVEHIPALKRRARTLCRNDFDADDLVSDTLTRALAHAGQFECGTNLHAWLFRIQLHCFISGHRRKKRERTVMARFANESQNAEPVTQRGGHELSNRVILAMAELPEPMQAVVELVDLCELSYREAAEELKVPVGTIMSRLFRGRNRLATQLADTPAAPSEIGARAA
jgi:RNA polymerase sigma-70 factor, ECF subfamily